MVDRVHAGYVTAGATRQRTNLASLKELVNDPPVWVPRYVDLAERLRANPSVASTLMQTAELACFDALCGDNTYTANAFDHLFTREHQSLLVAAVKCLQDIIWCQL